MDPNPMLALVPVAGALPPVTRFLWRKRHTARRAAGHTRDWLRCKRRGRLGSCSMKVVTVSPVLFTPEETIGGDTLYRCRICRRTDLVPRAW